MYVHVIEHIMQGKDKSISLSRNLIEDRWNLSKYFDYSVSLSVKMEDIWTVETVIYL